MKENNMYNQHDQSAEAQRQIDKQNNMKNEVLKTKTQNAFETSSPNKTHPMTKKCKRFKKIACTECRQQKAKCDASEKAPGPCSRCVKRGIPCKLDSDFKRTFKRAKIDELVKEYEIIKSKLQLSSDNKTKEIKLQPISPHLSPQYLPSIQSIQNTTNFLSNGLSSNVGNSSPLPDPNIFHLSNNNGLINTIQSPLTTRTPIPKATPPSFRSNSPLPSVGRPFPSYAMPKRANSPLNPDISVPTQIPTTASMPQMPISSVLAPSLSHDNSLSRANSSYSLTTLISAANASDSSMNHVSTTRQTSNASNNFSGWKVNHRPVRKPKIDPSLLECSPKSLGDLTLTEGQIVVLYTTFLTYYHPLLPVIDMEKNIEKIYRLCPALFWTIMFTALRGHHSLMPSITPSQCQKLYFTLSPILKSILAEITISPITRYAPSEVDEPILNASSVYSVQAFLIYTFWPPLTSSLSADSSWNTIGIAFYQAIRIGLHTPGLTSDILKSSNKDLMNEQIRTWIACNIVSQTIASVFGFPGFFQPYGSLSLSLSLKGNEIPHCLRQMLEIQTFDEQVEKTLNNNSYDPLRSSQSAERLPMIQLLENELNQLELRLCSNHEFPIDDFRVLALYASRLHLLSYNFLDNDQMANFELKRNFIKTYNAALAIIKHCHQAQERDSDFVHNLPNAYILTIWQASVIIARLVNSSYKTILDVEAGKTLYQTAITLAKKASVMKHDLAYRSCGIMKSTWNLFKTLDANESRPLIITVRSRMSANIFFDTLWVLREKCGMIKLKPTSKEKDRRDSIDSESDDEGISGETETKNDNSVEDTTGKEVRNRDVEARSVGGNTAPALRKKTSYHPESAARRIINTIPLDPQPIALAETPKDSNASSKQNSPYLSNYKSPTNTSDSSMRKIITPQSLVNPGTVNCHSSPEGRLNGSIDGTTPVDSRNTEITKNNSITLPQTINVVNSKPQLADPASQNGFVDGANAATDFMMDSWDVGNEFDTDMLFKDIESVMDEFGFHAGY